jgi:hypothetical protein
MHVFGAFDLDIQPGTPDNPALRYTRGEDGREIVRVLKPGGVLFCNISLRLSGTVDLEGRNLHRTVEKPDWWDAIFQSDEFTVTEADMEMTAWKRRPS